MARGRMLNRKISMNKAVAELYEKTGADGVLVYTWMIAHLDRDGRHHGDPSVIASAIAPRLNGIGASQVERMLSAANSLGLIRWYRNENEMYVEYPKFRENQRYMKYEKETPSEFPPFSDNGSALVRTSGEPSSAQCPPKGRERKGIEEKGREENVLSDKKPRNSNKESAKTQISGPVLPEVSAVFSVWKEYHPDSRLTNNARGLIRRRLKSGFTVEDLRLAVHGIHLDPWEDREKYLSLKYCFKDDSSIERFINFAKNPPKNKLPKHLQVVADFAAEEREKKNGAPEILRSHDNSKALLPWDGEN